MKDRASSMTLGQALADMVMENFRAVRDRAQQGLIALFAERGLKVPRADASAAEWSTWIEKNIEAFPVRLPGVRSPAW